MKRTSWQLLPLLLLTFFMFLAISTAQESHQEHASNEENATKPSKSASASSGPNDEDAATGAERVREASNILWKVKAPAVSKFTQYTRKPQGVFGSGIYYAKEAFALLFMNSLQPSDLLTTLPSPEPTKLAQPLSRAVSILEEAAQDGNPDAIYLLAEMNFHGNFSHPVNYEEAFRRYMQLSNLNGNSTAQYMLGFMYATGLNPAVPSDQAKSMLYHTFAAEQGNTRSQMTLGYRSHAGIATDRNCDESVHWYRKVAEKAVKYYRSGPPGGHALVRDAYRLADEEGGVFGEGASVSSSGPMAKQGGPTSDAHADLDDVMEYLHMQASKGDLSAKFGMARLHYDGSRGLMRDLKYAKKLFLSIARLYWNEDGTLNKDVPQKTERLATKSAGSLGRMFLRGEGTEQSYAKAKIWFQRAMSNGDPLSYYSLGLMYLYGLGVPQDVSKASDYLAAAADDKLAVAQTNLGILFLDQGDTMTASQYFMLAATSGHIEAYFYLADMHNNAVGRDRSCETAGSYYKIVAEKAELVWSSLREANEAYEEGDTRKALIGYLMAAEQGSENAQANVAWILDHSKPRWSPSAWFSSVQRSAKTAFGDARTALVYWTRSAKQSNVDSLVKMGDYYLSGLGTILSAEHAAACYQAAAEMIPPRSAQAMWNLGWMYENGLGMEQDFHLAKRNYDQALETNKEAYLPVKMSLWKLRWRNWWNRITRGGVHDIEEDETTDKKQRSFAEWLNDFLEADAALNYQQYEPDDWDETYDHMPGGDDFFADDDIDDAVLDTLLIGGLVAVLAWLIYYRQQQQRAAEQRRRQGVDAQQQGQGDQQQQRPPPVPGQQPDGGLFPRPGDPNWNAWVAGGIGP